MPEFCLHDLRSMDPALLSRNHRPEISKQNQKPREYIVRLGCYWLSVVWLSCLPLLVSAQDTELLHLE